MLKFFLVCLLISNSIGTEGGGDILNIENGKLTWYAPNSTQINIQEFEEKIGKLGCKNIKSLSLKIDSCVDDGDKTTLAKQIEYILSEITDLEFFSISLVKGQSSFDQYNFLISAEIVSNVFNSFKQIKKMNKLEQLDLLINAVPTVPLINQVTDLIIGSESLKTLTFKFTEGIAPENEKNKTHIENAYNILKSCAGFKKITVETTDHNN